MNLQELKAALLQEYPYKIELHAHTSPASGCSHISPKQMAQAYHKLGFDAIAITNHFMIQKDEKAAYLDRYLDDYEQTKREAEAYGIKVYLGTEIRFTENDNDYLIYGVDRQLLEQIYDLLPYGVENFRKNFSIPDSVFIQAHPMRNSCTPVAAELLDGVEVYNLHPNHNSRVGMAALYAGENRVPIQVAGSDFHHPDVQHEGLGAVCSRILPEDSYGLAKLLKERDFFLQVARNNVILP